MKFDPKEIEDIKINLPTAEHPFSFSIDYHSPITPRENLRRAFKGQAEWIPYAGDVAWFCPEIVPDNPARAFVIEAEPYKGPVGGKDIFNIDWEYVPSARGSIVRPGNPTVTDITKWKEVIHFPNLDDWDWEGSAKKNNEYLKNSTAYQNFCVFTGYFERLISWMDFGPAAYALMNKESKPYVHEMFTQLTDFWIDLVDHAIKYYGTNIDGFCFHDDWGAQHSPFFNKRVVDEMLVPYMKRLTDHIHSKGYTCELHSCGKLLKLITAIEEAGWDSWQGMTINDYEQAYNVLTKKLIMTAPVDEDINSMSEEEMKECVAKYVETFCANGRLPIIANRYPTKPEFFIELYKQSRIKLGK